MALCEECSYDLRGSYPLGRCSECNAPYDQDVLQADQMQSYRAVTIGFKILAVFSVLYFINSMCWIVSENFLEARLGRLEKIVTWIGIPGGAVLLLVLGLLLLHMQHMSRLNRPITDLRQARLIPSETLWWICVNIIALFAGLFFAWGNPIWNALLSHVRSLL